MILEESNQLYKATPKTTIEWNDIMLHNTIW